MLPDLLGGFPLPNYDQDAVDAACEQVRNFCNWHIAPSITETVSAHVHDGRVLLPSLYVTDVASVDGLADGFTWSADGTVRLSSHRCPTSHLHPPVTVTFTHGFESCPAVVRAAVAQIASRGLVPAAQVRSETVGPFSAAYYQTSEPLDGIYSYRRLSVA